MVFSFFKKPEKMVARPAAVPRPKEAREAVSSALEKPPALAAVPVVAPSLPEAAKADDSSLDYIDFVFSESSPDFHVEQDVSPVDSDAEEAAILYANGQDAAVRSLLEGAVHIHRTGPGERVWMMLFDLYQITGQKELFEALEIEYARAFEKSPPPWLDKSKAPAKSKDIVAGSLLFRGELTGDNKPAFDAVRQALDKNPRLRLDLSKVGLLDAAGCGCLLALLQQARKARRELELLGRDALAALIETRTESGRAEDSECWLLLLELLQLQGLHDAFEEAAINFAVTFEVSPPSWEPKRVAAPEPVLQLVMDDVGGDVSADAHVLRGEIKASRFADLPAYAGVHDPVFIDCAELRRMDFISAGALLNVLTTIRRTGKQVVFHHPNHLVAELFGVVGLNAVATIVFAKS